MSETKEICVESELNVALLAYTPDPEATVAAAAKLCYSASDVAGIKEIVASKSQEPFIGKLVDSGHLSPIEHASFTFAIEGISRGPALINSCGTAWLRTVSNPKGMSAWRTVSDI
jgi:thymidylate synthase ThyX